ncbi:MAG: alpha/beta hydrolase [Deltaproteobacteria bacterium]|nr:alpha/beta hydrolase [Deltaproteobacteria bacterium]
MRIMAVFLLVLLVGCQTMLPLARDLRKESRTVVLSGVVESDYDANQVLVVATAVGNDSTSEEAGREVVAFSRLSTTSAFALLVPDSRYYWVTAFADLNGNGRWDSGEAGGEVGGEVGLWAAPGNDFDFLEIALNERLEVVQGLAVAEMDSPPAAIRVRSGELSTLDDPHLSTEAGTQGLWQPLEFSQTIGFGIDFLEPFDPDRIALLFVNGAGGSPQDWRAAIENLDRSRFQPWLLVYPSGAPLGEMAGATTSLLEALAQKHGFQEVFLVAHSMGGLIARAVADRLGSPEARPSIRLLVTAATPFEGHSAASQGVRYSPAVVPSWRDLEPGSDYLTQLARTRLRSRLPHVVFFAFGGPTWRMSHNNDGTVTLPSQLPAWIQEDAASLRGFDRGHTGILTDPDMLKELGRVLREQQEALR